jgi:rhamnulokinase
MKDAILSYLSEYGKVAPKTEGDIISSVYHSLAYGYAKTCELIENNTGKTYDKIYIVGGGAKNTYLNELTERYSGKKVIALPIEATALGNLKIQMSK